MGYKIPNISLLTSTSLQTAALQSFRERVVFMKKNPVDKSKRIKILLSFHLNYRSYSNLNHVYSNFSNSEVKTTITQYSTLSPSLDLSKPLVVKGDGKSYSRNHTNGYVSKFPEGFFYYLGCGSNLHIFRDYKNHQVPAVCSGCW